MTRSLGDLGCHRSSLALRPVPLLRGRRCKSVRQNTRWPEVGYSPTSTRRKGRLLNYGRIKNGNGKFESCIVSWLRRKRLQESLCGIPCMEVALIIMLLVLHNKTRFGWVAAPSRHPVVTRPTLFQRTLGGFRRHRRQVLHLPQTRKSLRSSVIPLYTIQTELHMTVAPLIIPIPWIHLLRLLMTPILTQRICKAHRRLLARRTMVALTPRIHLWACLVYRLP